jgi:hypothetical protein
MSSKTPSSSTEEISPTRKDQSLQSRLTLLPRSLSLSLSGRFRSAKSMSMFLSIMLGSQKAPPLLNLETKVRRSYQTPCGKRKWKIGLMYTRRMLSGTLAAFTAQMFGYSSTSFEDLSLSRAHSCLFYQPPHRFANITLAQSLTFLRFPASHAQPSTTLNTMSAKRGQST